jgi:outer membrane protein assembly factor BamB
MRSFGMVVPFVLGLGLPGVNWADDWPCWRGPFRDGVSRETNLLTEWPKEGPRIVWKADLLGGYSSMAVARGRVFTLTKSKEQEIILCFDALTGTPQWRFGYPCAYAREPGLTEVAQVDSLSGPRATPAVDGDRLYTIGTTGIVHCLDLEKGESCWQRDLKQLGECPCPKHGYCNSPLVAGDYLFVQPGGANGKSIAALDKRTGKTVWRALDDSIGYATPISYEFAGCSQVVFFTGEGAVAVAPATGAVLWRSEWKDDETKLNIATPLYADGRVFISSYLNGGTVLQLAKEGNPAAIWKNTAMQNHFSSSVLYGGHLYGFSNTRLRCVEFATGKVAWDKTGLGKGSLLVAAGHLIIMGGRGDLVLAEATPKAYVEKGRWRLLEAPTLTAPALAGGLLYIRNEKLLLALDVQKMGS